MKCTVQYTVLVQVWYAWYAWYVWDSPVGMLEGRGRRVDYFVLATVSVMHYAP